MTLTIVVVLPGFPHVYLELIRKIGRLHIYLVQFLLVVVVVKYTWLRFGLNVSMRLPIHI